MVQEVSAVAAARIEITRIIASKKDLALRAPNAEKHFRS